VSLVVAQIHGEGISLVADTKITFYNDDTKTRQVFGNASPKLAILRDDVVIGVAGDNPDRAMHRLVSLRDRAIEDLIRAMLDTGYASFILAALSPSLTLLQVSDGQVDDRSSIRRAWIGDPAAFELFQQRYHEWSEDVDPAFRLMSSMQWLLSFNPVPSVGGYLTRVVTAGDGFRFVADPATVGPWFLESLSQATADGVRLTLRVPDGGDPTGYQILPAVGRPPTIGALAYYVPQVGTAWLFRHESPWKAITLKVDSMEELIVAAAGHGQTIVG